MENTLCSCTFSRTLPQHPLLEYNTTTTFSITLEVSRDFAGFRSPFWKTSSVRKSGGSLKSSKAWMKEKHVQLVGHHCACWCAKTSAGTVTTKLGPVYVRDRHLTHLSLDKMAAISQTIYSDAFFVDEKFCILTKISLKFILKGPIDIKPALDEIMAWRRIGNKPLSEPEILTRSTGAYMRH